MPAAARQPRRPRPCRPRSSQARDPAPAPSRGRFAGPEMAASGPRSRPSPGAARRAPASRPPREPRRRNAAAEAVPPKPAAPMPEAGRSRPRRRSPRAVAEKRRRRREAGGRAEKPAPRKRVPPAAATAPLRRAGRLHGARRHRAEGREGDLGRQAVIGRSPIDGARVPCGPATVTIERERWQPVTVDVNAQAGVAASVHERLRRPRATLAVSSSPPGAQISVNRVAAGAAPKQIDVQRFEKVQIKATLKGYQPWNKTRLSQGSGREARHPAGRAQVAARGCHTIRRLQRAGDRGNEDA